MQFTLTYDIGETPQCADERDFADVESAKAYARQNLVDTMTASSAERGSIAISVGPPGRRLGLYEMERDGEPLWTDRGGAP